MNRRTVIAIVVLVVIVGGMWLLRDIADGPQPKVAIFNLLSHPILDKSVSGIKSGLAEEGYSDEKVQFIEVNANGEMDKLNAFAKELIAADPDVIVPVSTPVTLAVYSEASVDIDIVYSTVTNPGDVGMDENPENMTGVSDVVNYEGNLDLIRELFPRARVLGIIYNAGERNSQFGVDRVRELAPRKGFELRITAIGTSTEVGDAASALAEEVDCYYVGSDNTVVTALPALLSVAIERGLPVIASDVGSVEKGALAAVSVDYENVGKAAGRLVADVLSTNKRPGEIEKIMLVGQSLMINAEAANRIGYEFPASVLERATPVSP